MARQPYRMEKNLEDAVEAYRKCRDEHYRAKASETETGKAHEKAKADVKLTGTAMDDAKRAMDVLIDMTTKPAGEP